MCVVQDIAQYFNTRGTFFYILLIVYTVVHEKQWYIIIFVFSFPSAAPVSYLILYGEIKVEAD